VLQTIGVWWQGFIMKGMRRKVLATRHARDTVSITTMHHPSKLFALLLLISTCCCPAQAQESGPSMNASGIYSKEKLATMKNQAEQGDSEAAYGIHQHFMFSHDPVRSIKWLRIAAIQGNAKAQHAMFVFLTFPGEAATLEDRLEARLWLNQAAQAGFESAVDQLKKMEKKP
jgi:hypothetical protein